MKTLALKVAEGRSVPLPDGSPWPASGARVEATAYIRRRLKDGDLVAADEAAATEDGQDGGSDEDPPAASADAAATETAATGRKAKK